MHLQTETAAGRFRASLNPTTTADAAFLRRLLLPPPLQDFGEHGRELISSEIALRLLRLLCGGPEAAAPLLAAYRLPGEAVQQLLQRAVFKVSGWVRA